MYLLPWHSLSKTGSHLSTSIRWYSMGQPLSLAMIISDVTSCPETIPYAVFDEHRSRYLLLSRKRSCKRRDRFYSKDLLFLRSLPYHYWSPIKNKKKKIDADGIQGTGPVFTFRLFRESAILFPVESHHVFSFHFNACWCPTFSGQRGGYVRLSTFHFKLSENFTFYILVFSFYFYLYTFDLFIGI